MARPTKLTPEVQADLIKWLRAGNYIETAARLVGLSKVTVFDWLRRGKDQRRGKYREFLNAVRGAQAEAETRMLLYVDGAAKKDWRAAVWRLEHMNPKRYGQKQRVEHVTPKGEQVRMGLTPETADAIRRQILGMGDDDA